MIVVGAADLHLPPTALTAASSVQERATELAADLMIIAGDLTTGPVSHHRHALTVLSAFAGPRLFVPGNHDLWQSGHRDTWHRYEVELPSAARAAGFHPLDSGPFVHQGYGFVGCLGWYDYTTRQLEPPESDARLSPAVVKRPRGSFHLISGREGLDWEQLQPDDYRTKALQSLDDNSRQGLVWNDGFYIDWGRPDETVVDYFVEKLQSQAAQVAAEADHLVAVTHFVPFVEVLPVARSVQGAYVRAFAGSTRLGDAIRKLPKIRAALFGHWHLPGVHDVGGLTVANVSINHMKEPPLRLEV